MKNIFYFKNFAKKKKIRKGEGCWTVRPKVEMCIQGEDWSNSTKLFGIVIVLKLGKSS